MASLRLIRSWWVILAFVSGFALAMLAEDLILDSHDNRIEFSAPRIHFLSGKPLDRLRNAAEVPFDFSITLWSGTKNHIFRRSVDRFVVSYDIWEETFSVVSKVQQPGKSASHLKAPATEAWCLLMGATMIRAHDVASAVQLRELVARPIQEVVT